MRAAPLLFALLSLFAFLSPFAGPAAAATAVLVYSEAGKFDKSFNEAAFDGARASGQPFREVEPKTASDYDTAITDAVALGDTVIVIGFRYADTLAKAADGHKNHRFVIIDGVVDKPNVQSILFKEQEGSYLAGIAAALASTSNIIGFVGGMEVPLIHRFRVGYTEGARSVRPGIKVLDAFAGKTPDAFRDPFAGGQIAGRMIDDGADVLFAAAGSTGLGVYIAAKAQARLAIGVDSNQNYLYPGTMLTSMVKRVDRAVEGAIRAAAAGRFSAGVTRLGLKEGGVDVATDVHNAKLFSPEIRAAVDKARAAIVAGTVTVTDAAK